jgi:hypothetical protein
MAEANRSAIAKLLTWDWLLDILSRPGFDRVAEGFVNEPRTEACSCCAWWRAAARCGAPRSCAAARDREEARIRARAHVGGIYALQGRLADLVARSLYEGLAALLGICTVIALILTRSLRAGVAMAFCTAAIPAVTLGIAGFMRMPLDIVVSPAINVAVGVAVDSMIHLGAAWRRARARGRKRARRTARAGAGHHRVLRRGDGGLLDLPALEFPADPALWARRRDGKRRRRGDGALGLPRPARI